MAVCSSEEEVVEVHQGPRVVDQYLRCCHSTALYLDLLAAFFSLNNLCCPLLLRRMEIMGAEVPNHQLGNLGLSAIRKGFE
jgi:hypothetical protein